MTRALAWAAYAAAAAFLALFVLAPIAFGAGAGASPFLLGEVLRHPAYRAGLGDALLVATATTLCAFALATPTAWLAARHRFRGRALAEALVLAPLVLPPFVGALGVDRLLAPYGALDALGARLGAWRLGDGPDPLAHHRLAVVVALEALGLYPVLHLTLARSFAALDPALLEAGRALGASGWALARRVALPLARPGAAAGGAVVFAWSFTELGTPLMLGVERIAPVQAYVGLAGIRQDARPYALVLVMLAIVLLVAVVARKLAGTADAPASIGVRAAPAPLTGARAVAAWAPFIAVFALAIAPHAAAAAIGLSRDWYRGVLPSGATLEHARAALAHPQVVPAIANSLRFSALATLVALALGGFLAWCGARWRPAGWRAVDAVAMLPLAVPGVVMAFGLLALGTRALPAWCDPFADPAPLLVAGYAVRRLPHALRAASAGFAHLPPALEEAAAACGAGAFARARRVVLPLIAPSLGAGALIAFSASMLEVSDSLVLAQRREAWPITRVIQDLVGVIGPGPALACALAAWAMLFLAACLVAAHALARARVRDAAMAVPDGAPAATVPR